MKDFWAVENTSNYVYGHPNADFRTPKEATYWLIDRRAQSSAGVEEI
jgi:hypothetical protein